MNVEYKKGTTALGMLVTVTVLVCVNIVKLMVWFAGQVAKAVQLAVPEIKEQIRSNAPGKADAITEKVRLRIVGEDGKPKPVVDVKSEEPGKQVVAL